MQYITPDRIGVCVSGPCVDAFVVICLSNAIQVVYPIQYSKFSTECAAEKILNIGQYLVNIWTKVSGFLFWATLYLYRNLASVTLKI